jgi:hypothetical protein
LQCLAVAGSESVGVVMAAEIGGLVGGAVRRSPALMEAAAKPFRHPEIRGWIRFTSEPAYARGVALVAGIVTQKDVDTLRPVVRPMGHEEWPKGHFHAAAFTYRPLKKGQVELAETVRVLFEGERLNAILHFRLLQERVFITQPGVGTIRRFAQERDQLFECGSIFPHRVGESVALQIQFQRFRAIRFDLGFLSRDALAHARLQNRLILFPRDGTERVLLVWIGFGFLRHQFLPNVLETKRLSVRLSRRQSSAKIKGEKPITISPPITGCPLYKVAGQALRLQPTPFFADSVHGARCRSPMRADFGRQFVQVCPNRSSRACAGSFPLERYETCDGLTLARDLNLHTLLANLLERY